MAISKETVQQLISLCSIHTEAFECDFVLNDELISAGASNGLAAWCYAKHKNGHLRCLDESSLKQWKSIYFQNTIQYQKYLAVYNKVSQLLRDAGIPVMALKGIALASSLYLDDGLRPMGDIDILVPEGSGFDALKVLLSKGAEPLVVPRSRYHEQVDAHVRAIKIDGVMVEIHQRLFTLGSNYHTPEVDFFNHAISINKQGHEIVRLNDVMMAYHLVAHAIKGIEMGGLRLGWLLDVALLFNSVKDRQGFIEQVLEIKPQKRQEMLEFINMCFLLMPGHKRIKENDREEVLRKITRLVNDHDHSKEHRLINLKHLVKTPGVAMKCRLLFYEFFPQKAYMQFRYNTMVNEPLWRMYLKRILRR
ncbi:nucleotidyltransferase family protein [Carboxylicivirga marina]|uniref:nucleotidyltransferase family protein n=1 Tax=Carboxylicivirga marina TaxID=2800988 RepID=UPI00259422BD|nr:nucleotidyltransferase family protein [uncultured Carboxylicivirga sp.]